MHLNGDHIVVDGLSSSTGETPAGQYDVEIAGAYNALFHVELHPRVIPSLQWGVEIRGADNLVYGCYLHDYGSPNPIQNPNGDSGFLLTVLTGVRNVIWSNHLTRGGHDSSLCKSECSDNRWLNNVMDGGWGHGWLNVLFSQHNLVEGNFIHSVAQMVTFYKPAMQLSESDNTLRRNVVVNSRSWALEVSSLMTGAASGNLVYNNTFYSPGGCYFQSSSRGARAYYNDVFANNICYRVGALATEIYLGNPTNRIVANDILAVENGKPQPEKPIIVWNRVVVGSDPKPLATADKSYAPFSRNRELAVPPEFVDEANLDFHLSAASPLIGQGVGIVDGDWGSPLGTLDLGAYGIPSVAGLNIPASADAGMEKAAAAARAGDPDSALEWLKTHPQAADAGALASAMARMAEADEDERAGLPPVATGSPMARFELVRQGREDPALWTALAADPGKVLEIANRYIYWGLDRDALELLHGEHPPVAADNVLALYDRAYCRERLGYAYYASDDFQKAAEMPVDAGLVPPPGMPLVLQLALEHNPLDATAHYLLGTLLLNAGRTESARSELRNALKLRPSFPAATAALSKAGGTPEAPTATALLHPAGLSAPSGGKPAIPAAPAGNSPIDLAAKALSVAAAGDVRGAQGYFTVQNFPQKKVEDEVREAYIELRLQRLLAEAAARNCNVVDQGLTTIGDDDRGLPFTFDGFGPFIRRMRFQYLLGFADMACGYKKEAPPAV